MIHYNAWFSFRPEAVERDALQHVRTFLAGLKARGLVQDFVLLKNRTAPGKTRLATFQAVIAFRDDDQMGRPFKEVAEAGFRTGAHGFMIEPVQDFWVEIFEEVMASDA